MALADICSELHRQRTGDIIGTRDLSTVSRDTNITHERCTQTEVCQGRFISCIWYVVDALKGGSEKLTKALAEHGVVLEEGIAWIQREAAWRKEGMQVYRAIVLDSLHGKIQGSQSSCKSEMPSA